MYDSCPFVAHVPREVSLHAFGMQDLPYVSFSSSMVLSDGAGPNEAREHSKGDVPYVSFASSMLRGNGTVTGEVRARLLWRYHGVGLQTHRVRWFTGTSKQVALRQLNDKHLAF